MELQGKRDRSDDVLAPYAGHHGAGVGSRHAEPELWPEGADWTNSEEILVFDAIRIYTESDGPVKTIRQANGFMPRVGI